MKQLMVVLLMLGLTMSAGAQGKIRSNGFHSRPKVIVVTPPAYYGFGYRYSPFYNPYNSFYSPFNEPYYRPSVIERIPSELQLKVDEIENEYAYRISNVRHNKSIAGKERRQQIRDLKHQREQEVITAKQRFAASKK
jgi:hypothetical protein